MRCSSSRQCSSNKPKWLGNYQEINVQRANHKAAEVNQSQERIRVYLQRLLPLVSNPEAYGALTQLLSNELTGLHEQLITPRRTDVGAVDLEEHWMVLGEIRCLQRLAITREIVQKKLDELNRPVN